MKKLVDGFFVSGQVCEEDIQAAARDGIAVIINNRCEGEMPGQPETAIVKTWAEAAGLRYHHIPINMPELNQETLCVFRDVMQSSDGPVYAFCGSGKRAALVWALVQAAAGEMSVEDILAAVTQAGYDASPIAAAMQQIHGQGL